MINATLKAKYINLARAYISEPNERHLAAAADLGRELVLSGDFLRHHRSEKHGNRGPADDYSA